MPRWDAKFPDTHVRRDPRGAFSQHPGFQRYRWDRCLHGVRAQRRCARRHWLFSDERGRSAQHPRGTGVPIRRCASLPDSRAQQCGGQPLLHRFACPYGDRVGHPGSVQTAATISESPAPDAGTLFVDYPRHIKLWGVSASTGLPGGIALQGEYSYCCNQPLQLPLAEVLLAVAGLPNQLTGTHPDTADQVPYGTEVSGFRRVKMHQLLGPRPRRSDRHWGPLRRSRSRKRAIRTSTSPATSNSRGQDAICRSPARTCRVHTTRRRPTASPPRTPGDIALPAVSITTMWSMAEPSRRTWHSRTT